MKKGIIAASLAFLLLATLTACQTWQEETVQTAVVQGIWSETHENKTAIVIPEGQAPRNSKPCRGIL